MKQHAAPGRTVGDGPYNRLILRNVTVIDGTGAPPQGPVDIVIDGNRISEVHLVASPLAQMQGPSRPQPGPDGREIDLAGHHVLPGLVDCHAHIGPPSKSPSAQYYYDLLLAHGVTSLRDPGSFGNGLDFVRREAERSDRNEIAAPRITPYVGFGQDRQEPFTDPGDARAWVQSVAERGAKGLKFFGYRADIFEAALDEAKRLGLGSACHHAQPNLPQANALTSARWGLSSVEHFYGLAEAMFEARRVQDYPIDYNYEDEQARFHNSGKVWHQAAEPGSARWNDVIEELVGLGTTLDPTFQVYIGNRDAERVRNLSWHKDYTAPQQWDFYTPSPHSHGSVFYDWTTEMEVTWRHAYERWMTFVRDFFHRGGRVTTGTDAGNAYKIYGFSQVEEMELLREAGLNPLEVIRSATLAGAELIGAGDERGSITPGKLADLLVVAENPVANLKVLYGNGRLRRQGDGTLRRVGGVKLTIKDGIVYSAPDLLARVRDEVREEREKRGLSELDPMP
ncbi:amidohydrolase family protein [Nonomuraea sp. K274]|uniref:Amidohydrolase family protein n=1 Tax=Nonomuraea cypriaca TaxID=1187855 RepID=A0A931A111_9ACTN|nr:amidohydrolase family protein [Nonomuraea cypriaca]MBF8184216.1 amidohydrolase family protein [Nonomuraea cypriaca]